MRATLMKMGPEFNPSGVVKGRFGPVAAGLVPYELDPVQATVEKAGRPTILSDTDGVTAFKNLAEVASVNAAYGLSLDPLYDPNSGPKSESPLTDEQVQWLEAWEEEKASVWEIAPDYRGIFALEQVAAAGYEVIVSSERPRRVAVELQKWYRYYAPQLSSAVKFVFEGKGSKARIAQSYGKRDPLVWIDDSPEFAQYAAPGIALWMPRRPWNKGVKASGVTSFKRWRKLLDYLGVEGAAR